MPRSEPSIVSTRTWKNGDEVKIHFASQTRVTHWFHNAATFERGPLVFALPLQAKWTELKHYAEKSSDWQLTSDENWNYAVAVPPASDPGCGTVVKEGSAGRIAFDSQNPRVFLEVSGRKLNTWNMGENSAGVLPLSPVQSKAEEVRLKLIPYGSAKLRITSFPFLTAACDVFGTLFTSEIALAADNLRHLLCSVRSARLARTTLDADRLPGPRRNPTETEKKC